VGSAAVLKINGNQVTKVGEIELGGLPEGVVFSPDGAYAYVGNFIDSDISILKINGAQVTDTGKKIKLPGHPASVTRSVGADSEAYFALSLIHPCAPPAPAERSRRID
jgi:DNA-binding beta-propeller fold protein YncE